MKVNTIVRYTVLGGLFLILLTPFVVTSNFFFPFITGKAFFFRILVEIIFFLWIALALADKEYRPKFSWLGVALAVFVAVIFVADLMSPNLLKSFWSNFERMEGFVTLIHLFAYFLVAASMLKGEKLWERFFQASVGVSILMGFYGILQLVGKIPINQGGVRLDGTLGNASYLSIFMLLNFFFALFLLVRFHKNYWLRWVYGVTMLFQLFIIYATETRGAVIGLFAGIFISSLLIALGAHKENEKTLRKIALVILTICIVIPAGFFAFRNQPFLKENPRMSRFVALADTLMNPALACQGEFKSRCFVWPMALKGFKERPLGWGQESFNYVFNKNYNPGMYGQEQWFDRTHNVVLDWLIAGGILGLLAYLSLFLLTLFYIWRQANHSLALKTFFKSLVTLWKGHEFFHLPEKSILTGLLVAYFVYNLSVFDNITSYILFFSILAYVHTISSSPITQFGEKVFSGEQIKYIAIPFALVFAGTAVYFVNVIPMRTSATLIKALHSQTEGPAKNLELFKKALAFNSFGDAEIREQLAQVSVQVLNAQSIPLAIKQEFYSFTQGQLLAQTKDTPSDARYFLFYGSFLNRVGSAKESIEVLEKASVLSPNKQTIMFELGSAYLNTGNKVRALEVAKQAFDLEPEYIEARIIYAVTAVYVGKYDLAREIMKPFENTPAEYDERLVQAYSKAGNLPLVSALLEKQVAGESGNSQARFALAGSYLNRSMRNKAVEILKKTALDFPAQKDQVEYYIREIQAGRNP